MPETYFPPPESRGGWRAALDPDAARQRGGVDVAALDRAWAFVSSLHADSSLLVVRHGWLCYERYQGLMSPTFNRDMHSCGKAFTSTAVGILIGERPDLFPDRLDQLVYDPTYLPPEHLPVHDQRRGRIRLGHLLSHTAGLRGNNGNTWDRSGPVTLDPPGPDGSFPDHVAYGHASWVHQGTHTHADPLWCDPGESYSYASAGPLLAGAIVRHLTGLEVADFMARHVFDPIGWEEWQWDRNPPEPNGSRHTKAQGGIKPRPRDALRFGYLHLQRGAWYGRQLIPAWYADAMRRPSDYNPIHRNYGLQVRLNAGGAAPGAPSDAYGPSGFADNYIYVVPSLDMVVVRIGGRDNAQARQTVWPTVLERVTAAGVD
ncbi:MAG TPA: serine hydrolase [Chloroflexota bacterium]|nr:serine hydrolase [Chloroflexota bacterium]